MHGGSQIRKLSNIKEIGLNMFLDYFIDPSMWRSFFFRRRYQMRRSLFLTIIEKVCARGSYFVLSMDVSGFLGLSLRQKITLRITHVCFRYMYRCYK